MNKVLATLGGSLATCALAAAAQAESAPSSAKDIVVTGLSAAQQNTSATGLPLTIMETPQAVTVIDQQQIKDFALTNVNSLLDTVTGINVERFESERTQYDSRGFGITNFQIDGIGLPLLSGGTQYGALDTILWDRVEAVRGANGMMTGVGNPSATINYIRKRPTTTLQASAAGYLGTYDDRRIEADLSGPLNASGTVRARVMGAHEDTNSWLKYRHENRNVIGGIVAWDVAPALTATAGYSRQQSDVRGSMWGGLPMNDSTGAQISYVRSATTAQPWTYWNTRNQNAFGELRYDLGHDWSVKGVYTFNRLQYDAKSLSAMDYPDAQTGEGVTGYAGLYLSDYKQNLFDAYASGPLTLLGRKHDVAFGVSTGRSSGREWEGLTDAEEAGDYTTLPLPAPAQLGTTTIAEPAFNTPVLQTVLVDRLTRAYGAVHWDLTDRLKAITGFAATWLSSTGTSYGADQTRKNSKVTPYVGALYDLLPNLKLYASYTSIFNPQTQVGISNTRLAPATGTSIEAGLKGQWLGGRLYTTASLFRARQSNLAEAAGTFEAGDAGQVGATYYIGQTTTSKGFEIEVAGKITRNWTISGGYTGFSLKGPDGQRVLTYIPNRTLKLATTYTIPALHDLKLGTNLRWQNATAIANSSVQDADGNDAVVRQRAYAVVDVMADIRVIDRVRAGINLRNLTNKTYLNSLLGGGQAYYASPRSFVASLRVTY